MKLSDLFEEEKPTSEIPFETAKEMEDMIKRGANTDEREWSNALELVHFVYNAHGVERPNPDMKEGWEQYQKFIELAVEELSKAKGLDGEWRMTKN